MKFTSNINQDMGKAHDDVLILHPHFQIVNEDPA